MTAERQRCSSISVALEEPMFATASTVRRWLLIEQPGPWGYSPPVDSRLPRRVARWLQGLQALGIRPVLLRRPGRSVTRGRHCYLVHSGPDRWWIEHRVLERPAELLELDLGAVTADRPPGFGEAFERPLYLVCTNGRRDPCCAERGRPVARALVAAIGDRVWESSHIGGDRFAGNLVCFPQGVYFGRVPPDAAVRLALGFESGVLDLEHYRGRSCFDFAVQAAEHFVRNASGLRGVDDLRLVDRTTDGGLVTARFAGAAGAVYAARVAVERSPRPRPVTCHADSPSAPRTYRLIDVR